MKRILFSLALLAPLVASAQDLRLWYRQPAAEWTEALPVGNGRLGAMVFGRPEVERIQINEESLWGGRRLDDNNPGALEHLPQIRQLLFDGRNAEAYDLATQHLVATPPSVRSYQTLMDLGLDGWGLGESTTDYVRELNLHDGIARTEFVANGIRYIREVFASAPDDVLVVRLAADARSAITTTLSLSRPQDAMTEVRGNRLLLHGQIMDEASDERGEGGLGMRFAGLVEVRAEGGTVQPVEGNKLQVTGADAVMLLVTGATDYNLDLLDLDRSIDPIAEAEQDLDGLMLATFDELRGRHLADHRALMRRVTLDLGPSPNANLPTDERLAAVQAGADDPGLVALYFQLGRYLLMGSSRAPGVLPANLQGVWNEHIDAPWQSDYHTNINLQMNYWPAEVAALPETALPLIRFMDLLRDPGRVTARAMYGAGGWTMHHNTDIFGRTGLHDAIHWGTFPMAGPWMTFSIWRHFEFSGDVGYLRETAYPIMKESAEFVLGFLVEGPNGRLVTAPSYSPENAFAHPETGEATQITYAPTMDLQIIQELFQNTIRAAEILDLDAGFQQELQAVLDRLPPMRVGRDGTIMEWIEDYEEAEPGHRHMSHLFSLHPGAAITPNTPDLFEAARKTIDRRLAHGGGHTGWSRAWIINFFARLRDGERAHENVHALLAKSTLPNLFDTHPPFQIDGNFGGTAGIAEMLVQSHLGGIDLLPALPAAWPEGRATGLRARGGFEVDVAWADGQLTGVVVRATQDGNCTLRYGDRAVTFDAEAGGAYAFDGTLR